VLVRGGTPTLQLGVNATCQIARSERGKMTIDLDLDLDLVRGNAAQRADLAARDHMMERSR
jgi:hypothetical protein